MAMEMPCGYACPQSFAPMRLAALLLLSAAALAQSQGPAAASKDPPLLRDCAALSFRNARLAPLTAVCESVRSMRRSLPNFICEQTTERHKPLRVGRRRIEGTPDDTIVDTITATVTFEDGVNHYSDIRVGDRPVPGDMFDIDGMTSMGEFGSDLLSIFLEENAAAFSWRERTKTLQGEALVFDFRVPAASNHAWVLKEKDANTHPRMEGALWVDAVTNRVLRLDLGAADIDWGFFTQRASRVTVFGEVHFPDSGDFLLPTISDATLCTWDDMCRRNTTQWKNCKRFLGKARIVSGIE